LVIVVRLVSAPVRTLCDFLPPLEPKINYHKTFRRVSLDRQHVRAALKSSVYVGKTKACAVLIRAYTSLQLVHIKMHGVY
jgi:hypothetical protein